MILEHAAFREKCSAVLHENVWLQGRGVTRCKNDDGGVGIETTEKGTRIYSRLSITRTLANSNLALTRTKAYFRWISFIFLL